LLYYEEILRLVDDRMAAYRLKEPVAETDMEPYREQILRMVWHTINTKVFDDGFTFGQLKIEDRRHESEFLIPYSLLYEAGQKAKPGYFKGFIDLIFRHQGKYYILDWKTTTIFEGYSKEAMAQNILEKRYDMQYKLYCVAVYEWLKSILVDFDFERDFGGVLYIYNRGMDVKDINSGIWFDKPQSLAVLDGFRKEILPYIDSSVLEEEKE
jgi:exodeoxyribonuclease V beta subunit